MSNGTQPLTFRQIITENCAYAWDEALKDPTSDIWFDQFMGYPSRATTAERAADRKEHGANFAQWLDTPLDDHGVVEDPNGCAYYVCLENNAGTRIVSDDDLDTLMTTYRDDGIVTPDNFS